MGGFERIEVFNAGFEFTTEAEIQSSNKFGSPLQAVDEIHMY